MSAASQRGDRAESAVARALGGQRAGGLQKHRAVPDVEPLTLPSGAVIVAEVKARPRVPALVAKALEQARRYAPAAFPVAVVVPRGGRGAVASLYLDDLLVLLGLRDLGQLPLPLAVPPKGRGK